MAGTLTPRLIEQAGLTDRQVQVLELWSKNMSYAQIGAALDLDRGTIRDHVKRGLRRLERATRDAA